MMLRPPVRGTPILGRLPGLAAFAAGAFLGGLATLVAAYVLGGFVSWMPSDARVAAAAAACVVVLAHSLGIAAVPVPQRRAMIPIERFDRRQAAAHFLFGLELGSGLRTYLPSLAPHLLAAFALAHVVPIWSLPLLAAGWAAGRSLPLVARLGDGRRGGWAGQVALRSRAARVGGVATVASGGLILLVGGI
jgi:hypothetical protein